VRRWRSAALAGRQDAAGTSFRFTRPRPSSGETGPSGPQLAVGAPLGAPLEPVKKVLTAAVPAL
jgi:hypothetical protein